MLSLLRPLGPGLPRVLHSMAASVGKRTKVSIGTHNGVFHCDEVLACTMLRLLPAYCNADIVRTRDVEALKTCDVVVDVGGVFDPSTLRFDHHQKGFTDTFSPSFQTKLSSAGLIYRHFGREIIRAALKDEELKDQEMEILFPRIYRTFVEAIDAVDNGISQYDTDLQPRYSIGSTLSSRVKSLNPWWNDPHPDVEQQFRKAMTMIESEFIDIIQFMHKSWIPARSIVSEAVSTRKSVSSTGEIILLEPFCPWKEHLDDLEEELKVDPTIKFVLYRDGGDNWRVQAVPIRFSFTNRVGLAEVWRGLRGEELSAVSGIPACVFVHISGFIGGNETKQGVLAMAEKSLELAGEA